MTLKTAILAAKKRFAENAVSAPMRITLKPWAVLELLPNSHTTMTPEQLKSLRKQAKATQAECAAMISVPTRRFQRWEAGKPCIPYSDFNLLCVLLRTEGRITLDQARTLMCPIAFDKLFCQKPRVCP